MQMSKLEADRESGKLNLDFLKRKNKKKEESPEVAAVKKAKQEEKKRIEVKK
jgi:hypothetical protein